MAVTYKDAGVDIQAGDDLVEWLKHGSKAKKSSQNKKLKNVVDGIGGFAALYRARFKGMKSPCLISCTDGVGTKVILAAETGVYEGVGQDLVAMCVNDLICTGGEPLFFLDYYASGRLNLKHAKAFLAGVRAACEKSNCVLIGGETAEMPGVYQGDHFDCAGFSVGVVDESTRLGPQRVKKGDVLIGVASSGFHSNGYSLLRRVFADDMAKWQDTLLTPTALYVELAATLRKRLGPHLHAMAHITGGGLDNIPRVLPEKLSAALEAWTLPEPFWVVKERAQLQWDDLLTTLNCGLGLVLVVHEKKSQVALKACQQAGHKAFVIGQVQRRPPKGRGWTLNTENFRRE